MKAIKIIIMMAVIIARSTLAYSQENTALKELHIGDHLADLTISGFYDDTTRHLALSELYRHKLLILDFWATWCGSCLTEFTGFDPIKKEFGQDVQILAVGYESYQQIDALFKRQPRLRSDSYQVLTHDVLLTKKLFPHKFLPHLVWIDQTGKVIAITEGTDLNRASISDAIAGRPISAREKKDNQLGMSVIFQPFHAMDTSFVSRSILTRKADGFPSFEGMQGYVKGEPTKFNRVFMGNENIRDLYRFALFADKLSGQNYSRIVFESKDSLKYMDPGSAPSSFKISKYKSVAEWEDQNLYCYELKMKDRIEDTLLRRYMVEDLNRYLNLNGRFERRYVSCYVLTKKTKENVNTFDPIKTTSLSREKHQNVVTLNRKQLLALLNERLNNGTIINDQNNFDQQAIPFDTHIKFGLNADEMNIKLAQYGLELVKAKSMVNVFVISEK